MSQQTSLFTVLSSRHPELNPHERTILWHICAQLETGGTDSVELTIRNLADATGLCWRTVQKYRRALLTKGVLRLLSAGRQRSRYALAAGFALPRGEPEKVIAPLEQPITCMTADEEVVALIMSITGACVSETDLSEAETLAGGKVKLRDCLRQIHANPRPPRSVRSVLSLISRLRYATGARPAQKY